MTTQISYRYRRGPRGYAIVVDGIVVGAIVRRKTKGRWQTGWRLVLPSGSDPPDVRRQARFDRR